jgi:PA14 domain
MLSTSSLRALALLVFLAAGPAACVETEGDVVFTPWDAATAGGMVAGCGGAEPPLGHLQGRVYPVPLETRRLPAFEGLQPVGTICMDRLDVAWRKGFFPGLQSRFEWFGIDFQGAFSVDRPGPYRFRLSSDDGSRLYVDGALILDNDGYHDVRTVEGVAALGPGPHRIAVPFWQGPGPLALILEVAPPGEGYQIFRMDRPLGGGPS